MSCPWAKVLAVHTVLTKPSIMQDTTLPKGQLAAAEALHNMHREAELRKPIAELALPGLVTLMYKSANKKGRKEAARLLAAVCEENSRLVADASLEGLATLLEVWHLPFGCYA